MDEELDGVWRIVDLDGAVDPDYAPYRRASTRFFRRVRWREVNDAFLRALRDSGDEGLPESLELAGANLRKCDRAALGLMWLEPITLFPGQITNGGHRVTEMRRQRQRWTVGYYSRDDIGGPWMRDLAEEPFV